VMDEKGKKVRKQGRRTCLRGSGDSVEEDKKEKSLLSGRGKRGRKNHHNVGKTFKEKREKNLARLNLT